MKAPALSLYAAYTKNREVVRSINADTPRRPASLAKLFTTAAVLTTRGGEFAPEVEGRVLDRNLYLLFEPDPFFTTESLVKLSEKINGLGIHFKKIFIVPLAAPPNRPRSGGRAYEAATTRLPFNFNSIEIMICPGTKNAVVRSFPGWADVAIEGGVAMEKSSTALDVDCSGRACSVSGTLAYGEGCISKFRSIEDPEALFLTSFANGIRSLGVKADGVDWGKMVDIPSSAQPAFTWSGRPIIDSIIAANQFSTNVIAESLVFSISDSGSSYALGMLGLNSFLHTVASSREHLVDGSGLSHDNLISTESIVKLLLTMNEGEMAIPFKASLSVGGKSGTLRERRLPPATRGKTGSLDGVSGVAGYMDSTAGEIAFAIIQEGVVDAVAAKKHEEQLLFQLVSDVRGGASNRASSAIKK